MNGFSKILYGINKLVLLLLAVSFLSLFLLSIDGFDFLKPFVENVTQYLPILLIPVTITMVVVLLLRYMSKGSNESVGIDDFLAAIVAIGVQIVTVITYGLVSGENATFSLGLPDLSSISPALSDAVDKATPNAVPIANIESQNNICRYSIKVTSLRVISATNNCV